MFDRLKFWRLVHRGEERGLSPKEVAQLDVLREKRPELAALEELDQTWLAVLRAQRLEPVASARFEQNLMRRLEVSSQKEKVRYWFPAVLGAAITAGVMFVIFQIISSPVAPIDLKNHEARNAGTPVEFPNYTP
ncbi:MAG: hypothetical protein JST40_09425 [Armatimonadetes bacterium]|nr:hypothetical protein [Armatimonadota bacterium]